MILMICLAVLLIKLYKQNLAGTLKLTLFPQGKSSGTFMDPHKFAYSPSFSISCWTKIAGVLAAGINHLTEGGHEHSITVWVTACSPASSVKSREQFIL